MALALFRYFCHEDKYGLACLVRTDIANDDNRSTSSITNQPERGMHIISVGILASSIIHIQSYLHFLQTEARFVVCVLSVDISILSKFRNSLSQSSVSHDRLKELLVQHEQPISVPVSIYVRYHQGFARIRSLRSLLMLDYFIDVFSISH